MSLSQAFQSSNYLTSSSHAFFTTTVNVSYEPTKIQNKCSAHNIYTNIQSIHSTLYPGAYAGTITQHIMFVYIYREFSALFEIAP